MSIRIEQRAIGDDFMPLSQQAKKNGWNVTFGGSFEAARTQQSEAAAELEKYASMTPEQRMAAAIHKQLGISEEDYAAMSPAEQKAVDAKLAQLMKQKIDEQIARQQSEAGVLKSGISL